jgi:hypothetical protein
MAVLVSVPFMVLPTSAGSPVGSLAGVFGGADFSYFMSFRSASALIYALRKFGREVSPTVSRRRTSTESYDECHDLFGSVPVISPE